MNKGSTDKTLAQVAAWAREGPRIKVTHFSRNFVHQIACTPGLDYATADAAVVVDADLQQPLPMIHEMIRRYCEGYDVANATRLVRVGESWFKRFSPWLLCRLMRSLVYKRLPRGRVPPDFAELPRWPATDAGNSPLPALYGCLGRNAQIAMPYERAARVRSKSKYPLHNMLAFAWTIATSFSILPLRIIMTFGLIVMLFGVEEALRPILAQILNWYTVIGWTELILAISVLGGTMLMSIGMLGEYIGEVYEQSKERPLYLVARTLNVESPKHEPASEPLSRSEYR